MRTWAIRLVIVAVLAGAGYGVFQLFRQLPQRQSQIPATKVRQSDVVVRSFARGELRAVRSVTLIAPNLFGTVQVTRLAALGSLAREKDLIVEFDDAEVLARLEEKQLEIDQIDEQIKKADADLAIRNNQDQVELLSAKYGVRRSELEVKRNELLPQIDQRKNDLNLEETRRRLRQLESDIKSRQEQAQAEMAVLREKKNKGTLEMARERMRLSQVKLLAPMGGLIAIRQNRQGMFFPGMQIPDIREGDQVQPGIPVADVLDLSELEVVAKIGELDRANLREGQEVLMRLDAVGDKVFHGKIKSMSGTATANIFSGDPAKKFDVVFSVDMQELLSGLGAKPEQIRRVLATAEANRRKPAAPGMPGGGMMMAAAGAGGGGVPVTMGAGAAPGGAPAPPPSPAGAGAGAPGGGAPGGRGGNAMTAGGAGGSREGRGNRMARPADGGSAASGGGAAPAGGGRPGGANMAGGERRSGGSPPAGMGRPQGAGAQGAPGAPGAGGPPMMFGGMGGGGRYSQKELESARLPEPIDAENQLEVLLRPGLLADVEIILEKVPNAINIPNQAVFEKEGKRVVYVRKGSAWEVREIKPLKRSETVMIIAEGLKPGEEIAMTDPTAKPGDAKKEKSGGPALPGGKS